jgi:hypothetical protein
MPLSRASLRHALMPFLLMFFNAEVETRSVIHSFVSGMKKRLRFKFTLNCLRVFLFEKETEFPPIAFLPVN